MRPAEIFLVAVAPFIGSFLGVVVLRVPAALSIISERSRCDACGSPLAVRDLVPILSWLALRAQCRSCGARLSKFFPAIEIAALIVALWAIVIVSDAALLPTCLLGWALLALAWIDARTLTLPHVITVPLTLAGLVSSGLLIHEIPWMQIVGAVVGFTSFLGISVLFRRIRGRDGLGLGDAFLLAAGGAWVGLEGLASVVLIASGLGLLWVLSLRLVGRATIFSTHISFGPFLAVGIWIVWLYGPVQLG